jgi:hypothetical protein
MEGGERSGNQRQLVISSIVVGVANENDYLIKISEAFQARAAAFGKT